MNASPARAAASARATFGDIDHAMQQMAENANFQSCAFCGHGLGQVFLSFRPPAAIGEGEILRPGMFFTIKPMINAEAMRLRFKDGWTAVTKDKSRWPKFRHSLGVTENPARKFSRSRQKGFTRPPYVWIEFGIQEGWLCPIMNAMNAECDP